MIEAPTSEIAIGMKITDFAARSPPRWSARTAIARPRAVDANVTTTTHHRLLMSVPRMAVKAPKATNSRPTISGATVGLPISTARPVRRFMEMPTNRAITRIAIPRMNGMLVNMFVQLSRSRLLVSVKIEV